MKTQEQIRARAKARRFLNRIEKEGGTIFFERKEQEGVYDEIELKDILFSSDNVASIAHKKAILRGDNELAELYALMTKTNAITKEKGVSFRLSSHDYQKIKETAQQNGITITNVLRNSLSL